MPSSRRKSAFRSRPRSPASIRLAYVICPMLLIASGAGFWLWLELTMADQIISLPLLCSLMSLIVVPFMLFAYLLVTAAQRSEYNRLFSGYQMRIDQLQKRLNDQDDLLNVVIGEDPDSIAIFDQNNTYWYVNPTAAAELRTEPKDVPGRAVSQLMGPDRSRKLEAQIEQVRRTGKPMAALEQRNDDAKGQVRFIQTHLHKIKTSIGFDHGVIMRSEDVTNLVVERERRESMLRQLVNTMVAVVDRRDPYAAGHSARVGQLAKAIAAQMVLSEKEIEAAEIAGSLMNFGKVLVPLHILTKTSALTAEELQLVRDSIMTSADILSLINFSGPVVPILRQVLERYDGAGVPNHLSGADILPAAYAVMVANTFIALVSPRAHRPGLGAAEALEILRKESGRQYDPKTVLAMVNCLDTRFPPI